MLSISTGVQTINVEYVKVAIPGGWEEQPGENYDETAWRRKHVGAVKYLDELEDFSNFPVYFPEADGTFLSDGVPHNETVIVRIAGEPDTAIAIHAKDLRAYLAGNLDPTG